MSQPPPKLRRIIAPWRSADHDDKRQTTRTGCALKASEEMTFAQEISAAIEAVDATRAGRRITAKKSRLTKILIEALSLVRAIGLSLAAVIIYGFLLIMVVRILESSGVDLFGLMQKIGTR